MAATGEAAPFEVAHDQPGSDLLVICDHASRHVPACYAGLGLDETTLMRHIAWDIGAADVARRLAPLIGASAVFCGTSRLVIDCNRTPDDPTSIPPVSDGVAIPGNRDVDAAERERRIARYLRPYQGEIARRLDAIRARGGRPFIVSSHSCTPVMNGFERPWQVGLLYPPGDRIAPRLIAELRRDPALNVGDNQPYAWDDPVGYAMGTYGIGQGVPMAVFEVRQDLIDTHHGAEAWAHRLHAALRPVLAAHAEGREP